MAYALEIRREECPATAEGFSLSDLWMLPLLLLVMIFEKFSRHLASLKQMRRSRPMPKDWQSFYPDLRQCEWAIHWLCLEGARQIILGGDLDLSAIGLDPEPPDSFQPAMPRSALSMHLRMQDIARFHADPERWIRRHAARLAGNCDRDRIPNPANFLSTSNPDPSNPATLNFRIRDVPVAIRGPPRLIPDCPQPTTYRLTRRTRENASSCPKTYSNPPHGLPPPFLVYRPIVSGLPRDTQ